MNKLLKSNHLILIIKILVVITAVFFIYRALQKESAYLTLLTTSFYVEIYKSSSFWTISIIITLLSVLNAIAEAVKWKYAIRKAFAINIAEALKAVYAGFALSFITPHGLGDYLGRIGMLRNVNRLHLVAPLFVARYSLYLITILFGNIGLYVFLNNSNYSDFIFAIYTLSCIVFFAFYFRLASFTKLLAKLPFYDKYEKYILLVEQYTFTELFILVSLSAVRYIIFSTQLLLIMYLLKIELPFEIMLSGITFVFLAKSILPTLSFLTDLTIREFAAVSFFAFYDVSSAPIILATLLLWVINIVIPSITGLFFINQLSVTVGND